MYVIFGARHAHCTNSLSSQKVYSIDLEAARAESAGQIFFAGTTTIETGKLVELLNDISKEPIEYPQVIEANYEKLFGPCTRGRILKPIRAGRPRTKIGPRKASCKVLEKREGLEEREVGKTPESCSRERIRRLYYATGSRLRDAPLVKFEPCYPFL